MTRPLVTASALLLFVGLAAAQQPANAPTDKPSEKPAEQQADEHISKATVFTIDYAALNTWFIDPKDRAMGDALALIPARLAEVLKDRNVNAPKDLAAIMNAAVPMLGKPGRFVVKYSDTPTGGLYGYGLSAGLATGDAAATKGLHERVMAILNSELNQPGRRGPQLRPSKRFPGMTDLQTPAAVLSFGPRESTTGWRYEITVGTFDDPDGGLEILPKAPEGSTPSYRIAMDFRGLTPARDWALQLAGRNAPEAQLVFDALERRGLLGPAGVAIEHSTGTLADRAIGVTRYRGAKAVAGKWAISTRPLTPDLARIVPADATTAFIARHAETWLADAFDALVTPPPRTTKDLDKVYAQIPDILRTIKEHAGIDVRDDLLAALGGSLAVYSSDTTGGGSLGACVAALSVRDRAKLAKSLATLAERANAAMADDQTPFGRAVTNASGRAVLRSWKSMGVDLWSLRVDGWPIPLELSLSLVDAAKGTPSDVAQGWLIAGFTPQAVIAAARQARGEGDAGLLSIPAVREAVPETALATKGITSIAYNDSPRSIRDGYTRLTMLGSAVAGMVRSPAGGREVPMLVPLYNDLAKGARPSVAWTWWEGDDVVTQTWSDRSMLVSVSSSFGALDIFTPLFSSLGSLGPMVAPRAGALRGIRADATSIWSPIERLAFTRDPELVLRLDNGWDALVERRGE